jgi:lysophospholipase
MSKAHEGSLDSRLGIQLFYRWRPADKARATVVVVHGWAEHSGRYGHVMDALNARGLSCLAFDCRGHGLAEGRRSYINRYDEYLADLDRAVVKARELSGERPPLFLLGHSQGGLIAARYASDPAYGCAGLAGVVLSSPAFGFALKVPAWKDLLGRVASKVAPHLAIPAGLDPRFISRDPAAVKAYLADPLVFDKATARWYQESLQAQQDAVAGAGAISVPILVMQAGDDRVADPAATERFVGRLPSKAKRYRVWPGLYHEIFNEREPDRAAVLTALGDWFDEQLG